MRSGDARSRPRVVLVNTRHHRGGGDSTYTFNLADVLRAEGHQVAFFAMQDARNLPDPNADLFVSNIDFAALNRARTPANGLRVLWRSIYSIEARRRFAELLDRTRPDVVHLQSIHGHITPSVVLEAGRRGVPVVWTLHDYKLICPNTHLLVDADGRVCEACRETRFYQAVLKRCKKGSFLASGVAALEAYVHRMLRVSERVTAFISPSAFLRSRLIECGLPPSRVHHVPLCLPLEEPVDDRTGVDGYFLFFGKVHPIKGIHPLLEACRSAPEIDLVVAGPVEQPLADRLPTLLPANARYVGMKHGEELRQLVRGAAAVVLPSLWYENQPYSILEAFAVGKPVIASEMGGMAELLKEGRGLLVPPGDPARLAEAMRWILSHAAEAAEMGDRAREYVRREHGPAVHYRRIMHVYQLAMGGA